MQSPLRLTFRHIDRSPALEARARELLIRLQRFDSHISQCHMTIEKSSGAHHSAAPYVVKIDFSLPGAQIHAENIARDGEQHSDAYTAVHAAFDNAKRQLLDLKRQQQTFEPYYEKADG
jgi:ribosomal subunit interface protein